MRSKGRYFKSGLRATPEFHWTEPPASPGGGKKEKYIHYKGFTLGELTANVGEFVLIRSTDSMNQEIMDCDVARLDELYHDFENKSEPYRAVVTWLCRPDFLPHTLDRHGWEEQGASPFNIKHEVVGEARHFEKDISAETIYYKCNVVTANIGENPESVASKLKKGEYPTYMHRFNMTMTKKNSKKVFGVEPVLALSKKKTTKKNVLGVISSMPMAEITPRSKRKASGDAGGVSKKVKSEDKDSSPELHGFVMESPGLQRGNVFTDDEFTKVETTTGSGKKITIKCGGDKKKFAPSSGLGSSQISSLLDSDEDMEEGFGTKKDSSRPVGRPKKPSPPTPPKKVASRPVRIKILKKPSPPTPRLSMLHTLSETLLVEESFISESLPAHIVPVTPLEKLLRACTIQKVVQFDHIYPSDVMDGSTKVGEGAFGEVFLIGAAGNDRPVLKVVPIAGDIPVNGETQTKLEDMLSEVIISDALSKLRQEAPNTTFGFVEVRGCHVFQGAYPPQLLTLWDNYNLEHESENDRPDNLPVDQLYIALEFNNAGKDLEKFTFKHASQALQAWKQVAHTLAVAEEELQFEHRDLHWGNVLVKETDDKFVQFTLGGDTFQVGVGLFYDTLNII